MKQTIPITSVQAFAYIITGSTSGKGSSSQGSMIVSFPGGARDGITRTPCCQSPRCRRMCSITSRSSMRETMRISFWHFGHFVVKLRRAGPQLGWFARDRDFFLKKIKALGAVRQNNRGKMMTGFVCPDESQPCSGNSQRRSHTSSHALSSTLHHTLVVYASSHALSALPLRRLEHGPAVRSMKNPFTTPEAPYSISTTAHSRNRAIDHRCCRRFLSAPAHRNIF